MKYNINDEWYTPLEEINKFLDPVITLFNNSKVWFPFDMDNSNFCAYAKLHKINFINTHIKQGFLNDFFKININCDFIISNPPYSKKVDVLDRLLKIGKPFAMLMSTGIFNNGKCLQLFSNENIKFVFVKKRIKFIGSNTTPPFNSVWVLFKFPYPYKVI